MASTKTHVTTTPAERTYGQYCPIAAGLDLIGDRWTLLILRELSMGDRRFTDLRGALGGIAPNLLTDRLRSLQSMDLVSVVELPPPAARSVYRLTAEGRRIEPVLRSVARFGVRYLSDHPTGWFDIERVVFSLLAPWRRRPEKKLRARFIAVGEDDQSETVDLVLDLGGMTVEPPDGDPDVTLRVRTADLLEARRSDAELVGQLSGDAESKRIFLDQFVLRMATSDDGVRSTRM
jgi:DNA-binding HxlR family transcriptional regulator